MRRPRRSAGVGGGLQRSRYLKVTAAMAVLMLTLVLWTAAGGKCTTTSYVGIMDDFMTQLVIAWRQKQQQQQQNMLIQVVFCIERAYLSFPSSII